MMTHNNISREPGWQGLLMQTRLHAGGEFQFAPFDDHLLSLHLGTPITLEHSQAGECLKRERMTSGRAIVVPAGQASFWRHAEATHYLNLHLSRALMKRTAAQMNLEGSGALSQTDPASFHDPQVEQIALLLRMEMESGALHGSLYAEMLASALCVHLLQRQRGSVLLPEPPLPASGFRAELRRAVTFIQDNLAADLSLDALAHEAGLSSYHFARLFTEAFGIAPHQYVIQARIEWSKALIVRGLALGDAAQQVGFSDQSHFTRHFKRLVGVTPRAFVRDADRKIVP